MEGLKSIEAGKGYMGFQSIEPKDGSEVDEVVNIMSTYLRIPKFTSFSVVAWHWCYGES